MRPQWTKDGYTKDGYAKQENKTQRKRKENTPNFLHKTPFSYSQTYAGLSSIQIRTDCISLSHTKNNCFKKVSLDHRVSCVEIQLCS